MGKMLIIVTITLVVVLETAAAIYFIPDGDQVTKSVRQSVEKARKEKLGDSDLLEKGERLEEDTNDPDDIEVKLGDFDITIHTSEYTYQVECTVFGKIDSGNKTTIEKLLEKNENRVREKILTTLRSVKVEDLEKYDSVSIKRKLLGNINSVFPGDGPLKTVILPAFNYYAQ